jgi:GxxExxY protein
MQELGAGFLESVYKNALFIALRQKGLRVSTEQAFEVVFRQQKIGRYVADLVVDDSVIIELKCCSVLLPEHQSQLVNYLTVSDIPVGLLVNFGNQKLEYKRMCHPKVYGERSGIDISIPSIR